MQNHRLQSLAIKTHSPKHYHVSARPGVTMKGALYREGDMGQHSCHDVLTSYCGLLNCHSTAAKRTVQMPQEYLLTMNVMQRQMQESNGLCYLGHRAKAKQ